MGVLQQSHKQNAKSDFTDKVKRHMSVLMEHMDGQVRVIAQQHGTVMEKFDIIDQRFDRLETAVMQNTIEIKGLKVEVKGLKDGQEELKVKIENLEVGQERIEKKIDEGLINHETRISHLEQKTGV
jgi:chromosome segregation ATPase